MTAEIWVSSVMGDSSIGNKQGIREKYLGEDWAPPEFTFGPTSEKVLHTLRKHNAGEKLARSDLTEAMYVFSEMIPLTGLFFHEADLVRTALHTLKPYTSNIIPVYLRNLGVRDILTVLTVQAYPFSSSILYSKLFLMIRPAICEWNSIKTTSNSMRE